MVFDELEIHFIVKRKYNEADGPVREPINRFEFGIEEIVQQRILLQKGLIPGTQ
jgi:hypothetical protein